MERTVLVFVDLGGVPHRVGRLWSRAPRAGKRQFRVRQDLARASRAFCAGTGIDARSRTVPYAAGQSVVWCDRGFSTGSVGPCAHATGRATRAAIAGFGPTTLLEMDFLLMVDDESRHGALRFAEQEGGPFLAPGGPSRIPPVVELPKLLAAERVIGETDTEEDLRILLAPGSSLGGARPKASVRDRDGHLAFAKFPHQADDVDIERWEALALTLAGASGYPGPRLAYRDRGREDGASAPPV